MDHCGVITVCDMTKFAAQHRTQQLSCLRAHNTVTVIFGTTSVLSLLCMSCQGLCEVLLVTPQEASGPGVLHWDLSHHHAYGAR